MKTPFQVIDFYDVGLLKGDFLLEIGCFPQQDYRESYRLLRKYFIAYDSFKLAKWIESVDEFPEDVTGFSRTMLSTTIPMGILRYFEDKLPDLKNNKTCIFRRYKFDD